MAVVGAIMVPHPPIILPEIGRGEERKIQKTIDAYNKAADFVAQLCPETIILSSPHSIMYSDYFHISQVNTQKETFYASLRYISMQLGKYRRDF